MTAETRSEQPTHLDPPKNLVQEMSLGSTLRRMVDDLYTNKDITEVLRGTEDDKAVQEFVETWKQALSLHLEETAQVSIENFLTAYSQFQNKRLGNSLTSSEQEPFRDQPDENKEEVFR